MAHKNCIDFRHAVEFSRIGRVPHIRPFQILRLGQPPQLYRSASPVSNPTASRHPPHQKPHPTVKPLARQASRHPQTLAARTPTLANPNHQSQIQQPEPTPPTHANTGTLSCLHTSARLIPTQTKWMDPGPVRTSPARPQHPQGLKNITQSKAIGQIGASHRALARPTR